MSGANILAAPPVIDLLPSSVLLATLGLRAIALPNQLWLRRTAQVNELRELRREMVKEVTCGAEALSADISSQAEISAQISLVFLWAEIYERESSNCRHFAGSRAVWKTE